MDGITRYFNETPMSYTDELMHYGVLGMKWGKRKAKIETKIIENRVRKQFWKNNKWQMKRNIELFANKGEYSKKDIKDFHKEVRKRDNKIISLAGKERVDTINNYLEFKLKGKKDPKIKQTEEYKVAESTYLGMKEYEKLRGKTYSLSQDAHRIKI